MPRHPHFAAALALVTTVSCQNVLSPKQKTADTSTPPPRADGVQCPGSPAEWQDFVEQFAANRELVDTCELQGCDEVFHQAVQTNAQQVFDACGDQLAQSPALRKCTDHMRTFTKVWLAQHSSDSYGFTVDNKAYDELLDGPTKPQGLMAVPEALAAALPDLGKVVAAAKANGWKYLTHDSAISGTRTFVYIPDPGGRFDQWLLLNLDDADAHVVDARYPLSMIGVQKTDAQGAPLPRVVLNFRDYEIKRGPLGLTLAKAPDANGKCYSCHVSGVRQLIDRRTKVLAAEPVKGEPGYGAEPPADFAFGRLQEFNAKLRSYGINDWAGMIAPETHGPVLGREQGCTGCHDGRTRGLLTVSTSTAQLRQKIFLELGMPPQPGVQSLLERNDAFGPALTSGERASLEATGNAHEQLLQAFEDSRYPALKAWLLETSCR